MHPPLCLSHTRPSPRASRRTQLFNLVVGCRAYVLASPMETVVDASLIVSACASLRPSCLNLVPFVMEAVCELLARGDTQVRKRARTHRVSFSSPPPSPAHVYPQPRIQRP